MGDWMTINLKDSNYPKRVRKSSISSYGKAGYYSYSTLRAPNSPVEEAVYVVYDGHELFVSQTEEELKKELEE
jgi:hypothetical protein